MRAIKNAKDVCDSLMLLLSTLIVNPGDADTTKDVLNAIGFLAKENLKMVYFSENLLSDLIEVVSITHKLVPHEI